MTSSASTRGTRAAQQSSVFELARVFTRLAPRQLSDEVSLAIAQMKRKGIQAGIASAFFVVALAFLLFLVIALVVAAIAALAIVMPTWLAALLIGAACLIVALIVGLIGMLRLRKALPLLPTDAIRGVKYDLGVLREGEDFDPATLDVQKVRQPKGEGRHDAEGRELPAEPVVTYDELLARTQARREHLAAVRDGLGRTLDLKTAMRNVVRETRLALANVSADDSVKELSEALRQRWAPLSFLALSLTFLLVLVRRLSRK